MIKEQIVKARIIIDGVRANYSPDRKYFNLMKYPEYIEELPIEEHAIILESQQGLDIDGNIYHALRYLVNDHDFDNYSIYLVARDKGVHEKIRQRVRILGCEKRCKILKMWSQDYFKAVASCKYLINDNTFASFFIKREGQVYLNLWHGTPLKTLGRKDKTRLHEIGNAQKNFLMSDYLLYPNEYTRDRMIDDYMLENICHAEVLVDGYPRNAVLADTSVRENTRKQLGAGDRKIYVYMPTWRGEEHNVILQEILRNINQRLRNDELLYVKLHPIAKEVINFKRLDKVVPYPDEIELYDFLSATDGLMTDYSSVMFDYAVTGKPVSIYAYDREEYMEEHGLYMDIDELPWRDADDIDDALANMRDKSNVPDQKWIDSFCAYDDRMSTRRILRYAILGENTGIRCEMINNNGLPNVLIYAGDLSRNGVTSSLKALLSQVDTGAKNYFVTFNASSVEFNRHVLSEFPDDVHYISIAGKMDATYEEKKALISYEYGWEDWNSLMEHAEAIFKRDIIRNYWDIEFETVIQFCGYVYKKIIEFTYFDAKKIIYVHSDMLKEIETRGLQRLEILEYAYDRYDAIVAVSDATRESTIEIIENSKYSNDNIDKITVINNIINCDAIREQAKLDVEFVEYTESNMEVDQIRKILGSDSKVFVNIGRFSKEKGQERLLDAFNRYWKIHKDSYLVVIGGNQMDDMYYRLANKLRLMACRKNVALILRMDNPYSILSRADGFILSSMYEGFGLVIMEADILGIPVVSTDIDGPRIFLEEYGGCMVENTTAGLFEGFNILGEGRADKLGVDYDRENCKNIKEFYKLIN